MTKTLKDLVFFLENCAGSEVFSHKDLVDEINKRGWLEYLLLEERIFDSRPKVAFMRLFKKRKGKKILVQVLTGLVDDDDSCNCYLLIGKKIYRVATPGGTKISLGE